MFIEMSDSILILGAGGIIATQSLLVWRVGKLERKFDNGINSRLQNIEKNCIKHHPEDIAVLVEK